MLGSEPTVPQISRCQQCTCAGSAAHTLHLDRLPHPAHCDAPCPLEGATLHWLGFNQGGVLCSVDSAGIVRACLRSYGFEWVPLLNCAALKKTKAEHHWVVGVTDSALMCVICKGDDPYPATLPRPVISALPLGMPLACSEPAEPALERER